MKYKKRIFSSMAIILALAISPISAMADENDISIDSSTDISTNISSDSLSDSVGFTIEDFKQSQNDDTVLESLDDMDLSDLADGTLTSEKLAETLSFSTEDILSAMHSALSGDDTSLSEVLQNYTPFEIDMDAYYSIEDLELKSENDFGTINLQYVTLSNDLAETYSNLDMSGFSRTAVDAFSDNYGDIASQVSLTTYSIPEGFSVSSILSAGSSQINSLYSSALSSDMFQSVKSNISFGSIFAKAQQGVSTYSLASTDTLRSMMKNSGVIDSLDSASQAKYDEIATTFDVNVEEEQAKQNAEAKIYDITKTQPSKIESAQKTIDAETEELKNDSDYADKVLADYMDYVLQNADCYDTAEYRNMTGELTFEDYLNGDTSTKGGAARELLKNYSDVALDGVASYSYPTSYEDLAAYDWALKQVNYDGFDAESFGLEDPTNGWADFWNFGSDNSLIHFQENASYVSQVAEQQKSNANTYNAQMEAYGVSE